MDKPHKEALQVAKEITVKFIETGRVSPSNFSEVFPMVYREVLRTIQDGGQRSGLSGSAPAAEAPDGRFPEERFEG